MYAYSPSLLGLSPATAPSSGSSQSTRLTPSAAEQLPTGCLSYGWQCIHTRAKCICVCLSHPLLPTLCSLLILEILSS